MKFCSSVLLIGAFSVLGRCQDTCSCGYSVPSPAGNATLLYSNAIEVDFLHLSEFQGVDCFRPDLRNQSEPNVGAKYGKMFDPNNVIPNPYLDAEQWDGDTTITDAEPGLSLWVRHQPVDSTESRSQMVPVGEISTPRDDLEYGSYRIGMKLPSLAGTVTGFFWYFNDSREIDIEYVSARVNESSTPLYLVLQTPESAAATFDASVTPYFQGAQLDYDPSAGFHEYRFDFTPEGMDFFADDKLLTSYTYEYPRTGGRLYVYHGSDGNSGWSQGPPAEDSAVVLSYVRAYFNSSAPENNTITACPSDSSEICTVPGAPTPSSGPSPSSAEEADQFFFNRGMCGEALQGSTRSAQGETQVNDWTMPGSSSGAESSSSSPSGTATGSEPAVETQSSSSRLQFNFAMACFGLFASVYAV